MPCFWWPETRHDLDLAKEVAACRPSKPLDWEGIAARLSKKFSTEHKPVELKGRECRVRLDRLLDKYKADDAKALKRLAENFLVCTYVRY